MEFDCGRYIHRPLQKIEGNEKSIEKKKRGKGKGKVNEWLGHLKSEKDFKRDGKDTNKGTMVCGEE